MYFYSFKHNYPTIDLEIDWYTYTDFFKIYVSKIYVSPYISIYVYIYFCLSIYIYLYQDICYKVYASELTNCCYPEYSRGYSCLEKNGKCLLF